MSREPARRESPRQRLGRAIQEAQTWLLAAQNADGAATFMLRTGDVLVAE